MTATNERERIGEGIDFDPLSLIGNNMSDIICIHAPDGCYRYITGAITILLGYCCEELIGHSPYDYLHPEDKERMYKDSHIHALTGKTEGTRIEYRFLRKDGSYSWLQSQTTPLLDASGNVTGLLTVSRDINDRKAVEKKLQESQELYLESERRVRDFAEAVPDYSFIFDEDGYYIEVFGNEKLLSKPKAYYAGRSVFEVLGVEDANFVLNEIKQVLATGEKRSEVREIKMGLEKRSVLGRTVPLSYKVKGKKTVAIIVTDITDQRRTERMLQVTYELRRRSDLINDIINGGEGSDKNIVYLSRKIGFDLSLPLFVCKFLSEKFNSSYGILQREKLNRAQEFKDLIIDGLGDMPNCVAWDCREGISVLCQATFKGDEWEQSKEIAKSIRNKLLEFDGTITFNIGISDVHCGVQGLKNSCQQALSAAIANRCQVMEETDIVHYQEAGIFQLIPELLGRDAVKDYIERNIGKLITYDGEKKINYLLTLEESLRGLSVREIADKLFLHPKSVVFRQKRIEKILNKDLSAYQTRLALAIALQLYKLNK